MIARLKRFYGEHRLAVLTTLGVVLTYIILATLGIGCPIKFFTGISCAGCGMTRACLSALRLDISQAFYYHPLWIALPVAAFLLVFFKLKKMDKSFIVTLYVCLALMVVVYVYRLIFAENDVVTISFEDGFIYRLVNKLL